MNNKGACRIAPATLGLLMSLSLSQNSSGIFSSQEKLNPILCLGNFRFGGDLNRRFGDLKNYFFLQIFQEVMTRRD